MWDVVATCVLALLTPSTITLAMSAEPDATEVKPVKLTVRLVPVLFTEVTLPVTPLLKLTLSLAAVGSKV